MSLDSTISDASFIGRQAELALLDSEWRARRSSFVPLYGRRRVGKSELLRRFAVGRRTVALVGKQAPAAQQLRELAESAAVALGEPLLAQVTPTGWKDALTQIVRVAGEGKLLLALDEFRWMVEAGPELPSVLQELWDRQWSRSGRLMLVVCGSYIGFMEREVLGRKSPLFGRRTAQIHLRPFPFREARRFHPEWSLADAAQAWFVCGGVPLYLRSFDPARSVAQNLREQLLSEFSPLRNEPDFLLREELREVALYHALLTALATGSKPLVDLERETGIARSSIPYYLERLGGLGYVRRRWPVTGRRASARSVRYVLSDPLLRTWFRFVWPNTSLLAQLGPDRVFDLRVRPEWTAWCGLQFEELCREALPFLYADECVTAAHEVGEYWDRDVQIDVVGVRDDGRVDLGECRWGAIGRAVPELRERAARFPSAGRTVGLRVFARRPRPKTVDAAIRWHTLEDLYGP